MCKWWRSILISHASIVSHKLLYFFAALICSFTMHTCTSAALLLRNVPKRQLFTAESSASKQDRFFKFKKYATCEWNPRLPVSSVSSRFGWLLCAQYKFLAGWPVADSQSLSLEGVLEAEPGMHCGNGLCSGIQQVQQKG